MKLELVAHASTSPPVIIRLFDFTPAEAQNLWYEVSRLANGINQRVAIHELPWVGPVGGCRLSLCVRTWDQAVVRMKTRTEFECGLTAGTWDNVAGLIEPFTRGAGGFQWLSGVPGEAYLLLSPTGEW